MPETPDTETIRSTIYLSGDSSPVVSHLTPVEVLAKIGDAYRMAGDHDDADGLIFVEVAPDSYVQPRYVSGVLKAPRWMTEEDGDDA